MFGGRLGTGEILVIVALLILVFGWKRLPDAARSLGRSMRIFKSEVSEMKNDGKSAASSETVRGERVQDRDRPERDEAPRPEPMPRSDSTPHTDVPHTDAAHTDSTHSDKPAGPVS